MQPARGYCGRAWPSTCLISWLTICLRSLTYLDSWQVVVWGGGGSRGLCSLGCWGCLPPLPLVYGISLCCCCFHSRWVSCLLGCPLGCLPFPSPCSFFVFFLSRRFICLPMFSFVLDMSSSCSQHSCGLALATVCSIFFSSCSSCSWVPFTTRL